jgi:hypothetical protein
MPASWNSEASAPNDTLLKCVPWLQHRPSAAMSLSAPGIESGKVGELFERDAGVGRDGVHLRQEARRVVRDLAIERFGIVERHVAELELELAIARHDVERGPPLMVPT